MSTNDDCNPHGITRPTVGELVLRRRLRVLRGILEDRSNVHHDRLVGLCDMLIETELVAQPKSVRR